MARYLGPKYKLSKSLGSYLKSARRGLESKCKLDVSQANMGGFLVHDRRIMVSNFRKSRR